MEKLISAIEKELKEVGEKGITTANIESTSKLVDMYKDLKEIPKENGNMMPMEYDGFYMNGRGGRGGNSGGYRGDGYMEGGYRGEGMYERNYGRQYYIEDNYGHDRGYDPHRRRMNEHINRIANGVDMYEYGRERYQHGGSEDRVIDGLEQLMYAVCMFVESTMEFAQTPQEKEIIRKHVQKLRNV